MTVVILGAVLMALLIVLTVVGVVGSRRPGGDVNGTFLDWDPAERAVWRQAVDEEDVEHLLRMTNERRRARGERALSMAEYQERLRREGA